MSPNKREREYARKRHAEWQERRETKAQRRARRRQTAAVVVAVVAVFAVAIGAFVLTRPDGTAPDTAATPTDGTTDAADQDAPADAENPCPPSTATPNPEPAQLDAVPDPAGAEGRTWQVTLETSCGPIGLELDGAAAPQAVASFLELSRTGFYDASPCHRLTTEGIFVLQCGDPTATGQGGPGYSYGPVENAPADDVYPAGTLAMARVGDDAESMGSQFFLVYEDSTIPSDSAGGYTIFGQITSGLEVVQQVADGGTGEDGTAPARSISIEGVTIQ